MTIEELVDSYGVTLAYFDNDLWQCMIHNYYLSRLVYHKIKKTNMT